RGGPLALQGWGQGRNALRWALWLACRLGFGLRKKSTGEKGPLMSEPMWRPSQERIAASAFSGFMRFAAGRTGKTSRDYASRWRWSVDDLEGFWDAVWDFCGIIAETKGSRVLADRDKMPGARFFPEARLNFAEN